MTSASINGITCKKPQDWYPISLNPKIFKDHTTKCWMRPHQENVFYNYKDENLVIIQHPGGSGKSTTIKFCFSHKLINNHKEKCVIVIPQHMIYKSFKKIELHFNDGEIVYWDISHNFCKNISKSKREEFKKFLLEPSVKTIDPKSIHNKVAITTYQLVSSVWETKLSESEKKDVIKNVGWIFDESHRIGYGNEDEPITKTTKIIELGLKNLDLNPCFWLVSATQFRGDKAAIIPEEHYDKFKIDFLPMDSYWKTMRNPIEQFSYDFYTYKTNPFKEVETALSKNKVPTLIICPKAGTRHGCKYTFSNKIKKIVRSIYGEDVKILDFVNEVDRDQLKQEFLDGKHQDVDVILSVSMMDEGVDWVQCAQVLDLYPSNSLRIQVQRIYRLWRENEGKKEISYISFLRFSDKATDEEEYRRELNNIIATWTGAMLIQDLISPIDIDELQKDKNNPTSSRTPSFMGNAFQRAFPDLNKQDEVLNKVFEKFVILANDCKEKFDRKPNKEESKKCIEDVIESFGITKEVEDIAKVIAKMFIRRCELDVGIDLRHVVDSGFEIIWKDEFYDKLLKFGSKTLGIGDTFQKFRKCFGERITNQIEQYKKLKELIESKNGKLLSEEYIDAKNKIKVQCEHGHIWNTIPHNILGGRWCSVCTGHDKDVQYNKLKKLVESKGGKLLSEKYVKNNTKVKVECGHNHTWKITPAGLFTGNWCLICAGKDKEYQYNKLKKLVESKGGKLLSEKYINRDTKVKVQCEHNHTWETKAYNLFDDTWCHICSGHNKEYQYNKLKKLIESKGGKLLSEKYINNNTKITVQCEHEHAWEVTPASLIKSKSWCSVCFGRDKEYQYNKLKELIESKKGKLLSGEYSRCDIKVEVKCEYGHIWKVTPSGLFGGSWCLTCSGRNKDSQYNKLKELIESKGGKLISSKYINAKTKMKVECKNKHHWEATSDNLFRGKWCPACSGRDKNVQYNKLKKLVESKGGKLLSEKYINGDTKVKVQCEHKHTWEATPNELFRGNWCTICSGRDKDVQYNKLKELIESKGGKLISEKYMGCDTKVKVQCEHGHTWETTPTCLVRMNTWCSVCVGRDKDVQYNKLKELIESKGGKLLSEKYINNNTKIKVQCEHGHTWEVVPNSILSGTWCPICIGRNKYAQQNKLITIIKSKNGKLISGKYENNLTKVKVQCEYSHTWDISPSNLFRNKWCPECYKNRRKKPNA